MKINLKRLLSVCLTVVLLISSVPVVSSATSDYGLFIAETKIESDSYWVNDGRGGITAEGASLDNYNLKVTFEESLINLTINNLSLSGQIIYDAIKNPSDIYVDVIGENNIAFEFNYADYESAIYSDGNISFVGNGSLNITAQENNDSSRYIDVFGIDAADVSFEDDVKANITVTTNCVDTDSIGIYSSNSYVKDNAQVILKTQGGSGACCWATEYLYLQDKGILKTDAYDMLEENEKYNRSATGISSGSIEMSGSSYIEAINTCDTSNIVWNCAIAARDLTMAGQSKIIAKSADAKYNYNTLWEDNMGSIAVDIDRSITLCDDAKLVAESGYASFGYEIYSIGVDVGFSSDKEGIYMKGVLEVYDDASVSVKSGDGNCSIGINATEIYASNNAKIESCSGAAAVKSCGIESDLLKASGKSELIVASGDVESRDYENTSWSDGYALNDCSTTIALKSDEIYLSEQAELTACAAEATMIDEDDVVSSFGICTGRMILFDNVRAKAIGGKINDAFPIDGFRHISAGIGFTAESIDFDKTIETSDSTNLVAVGAYYGIYGEDDIVFKGESQAYVYGYCSALNQFIVDDSPKVELVSETAVAQPVEDGLGIELSENFNLDVWVSETVDFKDAVKWDGSTWLYDYKSLKIDKDADIHSYSITRKEATCFENGCTTYSCDHCGDSYEIEITSPGHVMKSESIPGNCTEKSKMVYSCNKCDFTYFVEGWVEHKFTQWTVVEEATCEKDGLQKSCCDLCGFETTIELMVPHTYDYDNPIVTLEPTCTESGHYAYECQICGYLDDYWYMEALGHNYEITNKTVENCQTIVTQTCENCGDTKTMQFASHVTKNEIKQPTCTEDGSVLTKCVVCGMNSSEILSKTGHYYQSEVVESTATDDGYIKYSCKNCSDSYTETIVSTGCEHSYELSDYSSETCRLPGSETYVCSKCEDSYTVSICRKAHNWIELGRNESSCLSEGMILYYCEDCVNVGVMEYKIVIIPEIDHESIEWEYDYDNGKKTRGCDHCDFTEAEDLGRYGDINGDGKTNSSDALQILQYSVGMAQDVDKKFADINKDGYVNSSDALIALQISTGNYKGDLWFDFE